MPDSMSDFSFFSVTLFLDVLIHVLIVLWIRSKIVAIRRRLDELTLRAVTPASSHEAARLYKTPSVLKEGRSSRLPLLRSNLHSRRAQQNSKKAFDSAVDEIMEDLNALTRRRTGYTQAWNHRLQDSSAPIRIFFHPNGPYPGLRSRFGMQPMDWDDERYSDRDDSDKDDYGGHYARHTDERSLSENRDRGEKHRAREKSSSEFYRKADELMKNAEEFGRAHEERRRGREGKDERLRGEEDRSPISKERRRRSKSYEPTESYKCTAQDDAHRCYFPKATKDFENDAHTNPFQDERKKEKGKGKAGSSD